MIEPYRKLYPERTGAVRNGHWECRLELDWCLDADGETLEKSTQVWRWGNNAVTSKVSKSLMNAVLLTAEDDEEQV